MVRVNSLNCYVATPAQSTTKGIIMSLPQLKLVGWWKSMQPWKTRGICSANSSAQHLLLDGLDHRIPKKNIVNTYSYTACTTVYICNYAHIMTGIMNMKAHWIKPCNALRYIKATSTNVCRKIDELRPWRCCLAMIFGTIWYLCETAKVCWHVWCAHWPAQAVLRHAGGVSRLRTWVIFGGPEAVVFWAASTFAVAISRSLEAVWSKKIDSETGVAFRRAQCATLWFPCFPLRIWRAQEWFHGSMSWFSGEEPVHEQKCLDPPQRLTTLLSAFLIFLWPQCWLSSFSWGVNNWSNQNCLNVDNNHDPFLSCNPPLSGHRRKPSWGTPSFGMNYCCAMEFLCLLVCGGFDRNTRTL